MKKIIILGSTILLILLCCIGYYFYSNNKMINESKIANKTYENYYNVEVLGTDVASLFNKVIDENTKNGVEKDKDGNYIDNNKNSIDLKIKFKELDKDISIGAIEKQDVNQFVRNFGAFSFKCTKIEYHQNTHKISYMYFEQL